MFFNVEAMPFPRIPTLLGVGHVPRLSVDPIPRQQTFEPRNHLTMPSRRAGVAELASVLQQLLDKIGVASDLGAMEKHEAKQAVETVAVAAKAPGEDPPDFAGRFTAIASNCWSGPNLCT